MTSELLSLAGNVQAITLADQRFVVLPESEYLRLRSLAGEDEPPMPPPDADGNYPAVEALQVSGEPHLYDINAQALQDSLVFGESALHCQYTNFHAVSIYQPLCASSSWGGICLMSRPGMASPRCFETSAMTAAS